jgi:hypothetical protein
MFNQNKYPQEIWGKLKLTNHNLVSLIEDIVKTRKSMLAYQAKFCGNHSSIIDYLAKDYEALVKLAQERGIKITPIFKEKVV